MALSPYINEIILTASIESVVPLNAQGILTQVIATSTYDLDSGTHIYTVKVTDGVLQYQVGRKQAASASTCVGISFNGRDGTATFDITPTAEGYTYKATSITDFYGSVNSDATLANKIYGSAEVDVVSDVTGEIRAGGIGNVTAFDADTFWSSKSSMVDKNKTPLYLWIAADSTQGSRGIVLERIRYSDGTYRNLRTATMTTLATVQTAFARDGITLGSMTDGGDYIDLTPTYEKENQTRLIYQRFGHLDYGQSGNEYGHTGGDGD